MNVRQKVGSLYSEVGWVGSLYSEVGWVGSLYSEVRYSDLNPFSANGVLKPLFIQNPVLKNPVLKNPVLRIKPKTPKRFF